MNLQELYDSTLAIGTDHVAATQAAHDAFAAQLANIRAATDAKVSPPPAEISPPPPIPVEPPPEAIPGV